MNTYGLFSLVPLIVFLPVLGLLINLIFGKRMSEIAIGTVASLASGLAFVVSALLGILYGPVAGWRKLSRSRTGSISAT